MLAVTNTNKPALPTRSPDISDDSADTCSRNSCSRHPLTIGVTMPEAAENIDISTLTFSTLGLVYVAINKIMAETIIAIKGIVFVKINNKKIEKIIKTSEIIFNKEIFSFKNKYPSPILIIGLIKYPIDASWSLLIFIAKTKAVQLQVINNPVIDKKKILFFSLKIKKNSLILPKNNIIINKKKDDQIERWLIISIAGINIISLK